MQIFSRIAEKMTIVPRAQFKDQVIQFYAEYNVSGDLYSDHWKLNLSPYCH